MCFSIVTEQQRNSLPQWTKLHLDCDQFIFALVLGFFDQYKIQLALSLGCGVKEGAQLTVLLLYLSLLRCLHSLLLLKKDKQMASLLSSK